MFDPNDYGGRDTPYAAQTMFGSHRGGMDYGGLGNEGLGYVTDINSSEDQTFDPSAMGYLDSAPGIPSVGMSMSNMMPTMGAVANPSAQTMMPRAAPERRTVVALDPYEHVKQNARFNGEAPASAPASADAAAGGASDAGSIAGAVGAVAGLFGSIVGIVAQNKMLKTQSQMAATDAATQLQLAQSSIQVANAQAEAAKAQALAAAYGQPQTPWGLILGLGGVAVLGGVIFVAAKKKKKKKAE